jgi:hypothetical protein
MPESYDLERVLPDWRPLLPEEAQRAQRELRNELSPSHILYGVSATALAQGPDHPDDFLFRIEGPQEYFAFVHLSWAREATGEFPYTKLYPTLRDFADDA